MPLLDRLTLVFVGLTGACAVGIGAYAAHGAGDAWVKEMLQTGVVYHLAHLPVLLWLAHRSAGVRATGGRATGGLAYRAAQGLFVLAIALFCGSLYVTGLTGGELRATAVAPFGGTSFMLGWLALAAAAALPGQR